MSVNSPVDLQIREGGSLLGVTSAEKLMMLAVTTISSWRARSSNSRPRFPWTSRRQGDQREYHGAERIALDQRAAVGRRVARRATARGDDAVCQPKCRCTHEVVWRHPQLGERRQTVVVTAKTPVRLQIDLSKVMRLASLALVAFALLGQNDRQPRPATDLSAAKALYASGR